MEEVTVCARVRKQFPAAASSASAARGFVREALGHWLDDQPAAAESARVDRDMTTELNLTTDLELITGELVSNAARNGRSHFSVDLEAHRDHLMLTVADDGEPTTGLTARLGQQPLFRESGRGLLMVAHLSTSWGVRIERGERSWNGIATAVWARVDLPDHRSLALACSL
jgi:anti-sigma regulatory factor (Ser/Thr protein kinase)